MSSFPPEDPSLPPGAVVAGKLRVVRTLGAGGMGVVYEVEHELTKHRRALKILHARVARLPSVVERFVREASAAARVGNAHVAETFDAGRLDTGEPYLLMELLDGETLDQRLQRTGPIEPGELADLVCQACEGVQAAHDAGIVHRDLKPENLFLATKGGAPFVKILDFGISKFDADGTGALGITTEGSVMGTPYYMSPEQVRGAASVDARTDVYALGVMLYECVCGVRPFDASSLEHLAILIHEGKPAPLAKRCASLPAGFCETVHRAMAADRDKRFESAGALAAALGPWRSPTLRASIQGSTTPPQRVVVRASSRPASVRDEAPASAVVPSTNAALAATLATGPPPKRPARARAWWLSAAVLLASVALGVGVAVMGGARPTRTSSGAAAAPPAAMTVHATPEWRAPSVDLSPFPPPIACAGAASAVGPPLSATAVQTARPSGRSRASATALAPTSTSRVDQTGLASENPFR